MFHSALFVKLARVFFVRMHNRLFLLFDIDRKIANFTIAAMKKWAGVSLCIYTYRLCCQLFIIALR